MEKEIDRFIEYLKYQRNYSNFTCNNYNKDLNEYNSFILSNKINPASYPPFASYSGVINLYKCSYIYVSPIPLLIPDTNDKIKITITTNINAILLWFTLIIRAINENIYTNNKVK